MRLITLNIWGGHVRDPLHQFIASHQNIDIFCFQEVYHNAKAMISQEVRKVSLNIFAELQALLPNHIGYFRPVVENIYGISIFIKKNIEVLGEGDYLIHHNPDYPGYGPTHSRILQWIKYRVDEEVYAVVNVHGLWNGKGKTDTEERLAQSKKIKDFMAAIDGHKILCGDFNLKPDTQSLKMLASDMHNLIDAYQVTSTRTSFYPKEEKFADYIFTSKGVTINKFEVLKDEVSDHAPLLLDFCVESN
jgi:endonuclease/exonuclease/phosphatase family metal-dependent hydrolase